MPKTPEHQPGARRGSELPAASRPQGKGLAATPPPLLSPSGKAERTRPGPEPFVAAATAAKSLQSCLTLCNPMDCNLPSSSVLGDSPCKNTGVGCHFLLQENLLDSGIETTSFMSPALTDRFFTTSTTWKAPIIYIKYTDRNPHVSHTTSDPIGTGDS